MSPTENRKNRSTQELFSLFTIRYSEFLFRGLKKKGAMTKKNYFTTAFSTFFAFQRRFFA